MEILNSRPCIMRGCTALGVCLDNRYDVGKVLSDKGLTNRIPDEKGAWFCQEHATEHLFPVIDAASGYTVDNIVSEFRKDGMMR